MKMFQVVLKNFAILGILPQHQSSRRLSFNKKELFGFLSIGGLISSQAMYIFYVANGFTEHINSVCAVSATTVVFVCFATIVLSKVKLFEVIHRIERLIDIRCKDPKSRKLFLKTSQQIERLSEIVFTLLVKIALQLVILPIGFVSFAIYFCTDAGSDAFQLPFPMWVPFDWTNPIGYLVAITIEYIILGYEYSIDASSVGLGIGAYRIVIWAIKEIQRILHTIRDELRTKKHQSNDELKLLFSEFIELHAVTKQLEHSFSVIFQPIIMALCTWSLIAISVTMLSLQVEIFRHEYAMSALPNAITLGVIGISLVLIACDLGQRTGDAFEQIVNTIEQLNWYLFPLEIKKMLPMIIANAQQPVLLECFGGIKCTREVFSKILRCAYSYFTVLSQLGA